MSKKLVGLTAVLLLGLAGSVAEGCFIGIGLYKDPAHWCDGCVPKMGTPCEWGCMNVDGSVCIIDSTHVGADAANPAGLYVGCYGADNTLIMTGGVLDTSYVNVARGDSDSGSNGYFEMTGGVVQNVEWFEIPNQFGMNTTPGESITGVMDMSGGEVYTQHIRLGDGSVTVASGGFGTINLSGDAIFAITVDGYQAIGDTWPAGSLNISENAMFKWAGDHVAEVNDMIGAGVITNTTGREPYFDSEDTIIGPGTLTLLTPNGGETLVAGNAYTITWQSQGTISDVKIEYSANNGGNWTQVDPPNIGNSGSYDWLVAAVDSNECLVRVSDATLPSVNDTSDDVFTMFECQGPLIGDLNGDCYVDWRDFGIFAGHWLDCGNPFDPACIE